MSNEVDKDIARTYIKALGRGDAELCRSLLTDDFVAIISGRSSISGPMTRDQVLDFFAEVPKIAKDGIPLEILSLTAEDDRVACESEGHVTLNDGAEYNNMYLHLFRFRDGKICQLKEYMDTELACQVYLPVWLAAQEK
ncbi:nuclear transport factor 2 family protein [Streptomyces sp. NPDC096310]|uniref:nuclear transport factor 2 family protein n=1 Tax=Streptomyces sp. NPDC096310 TaxID=3366082 RepID=UPI00381FC942